MALARSRAALRCCYHITPVSRQCFSSSRQLQHPRSARTLSIPQTIRSDDQPDEETVETMIQWKDSMARLRRDADHDGVMASLRAIRNKNDRFLTSEAAQPILFDILDSAITNQKWTAEIIQIAEHLRDQHNFEWPELYHRLIEHHLHEGRGDLAVFWHLNLSPKFPPTEVTVRNLLIKFIENPSEDVQSALRSIYSFSPGRNLYDVVLPQLYAAGKSNLARKWRKTFKLHKDNPKSARCRPFLRYLASYYPSIQLSAEERRWADLEPLSTTTSDTDPAPPESRPYSDSIIARWFASSWTSVEFAINFIAQIGIPAIGPRSLQALALREATASDLFARLKELDAAGIGIPTNTYGIAIAQFARERDDESLTAILNCDIHPDEFDDSETRALLLNAAKRTGNSAQQYLLERVERILQTLESTPARMLAETILPAQGVPKDITTTEPVSQQAAMAVLQSIFGRILMHNKRILLKQHTQDHVDLAIAAMFRMTRSNFAIPTKYWAHLLEILGRSGRLQDLEAISLQLVKLYTSNKRGLVLIHGTDVPRSSFRYADGSEDSAKAFDEHIEEPPLSGAQLEVDLPVSPKAAGDVYEQTMNSEGGEAASTDDYNNLFAARDTPSRMPSVDHKQESLRRLQQVFTKTSKSNDGHEAPQAESKDVSSSTNISSSTAGEVTSADDFYALFSTRRHEHGTVKKSRKSRQEIATERLNALMASDDPMQSTGKQASKRIAGPQPQELMIRSYYGYPLAEREYIPADLPFSHRQHPLQKVFNSTMQRRIIRWSFDQLMRAKSAQVNKYTLLRGESWDFASGVRMLALLRDQGVLIDQDLLCASIVSRIAVSQIPGRLQHSSRDTTAQSMEYLLRSMELAWGDKLFESAVELNDRVEVSKVQTWDRYSRLFEKRERRKRKDIYNVGRAKTL